MASDDWIRLIGDHMASPLGGGLGFGWLLYASCDQCGAGVREPCVGELFPHRDRKTRREVYLQGLAAETSPGEAV